MPYYFWICPASTAEHDQPGPRVPLRMRIVQLQLFVGVSMILFTMFNEVVIVVVVLDE